MNQTAEHDRSLPVPAILAAGTGVGFAGDYLLRASGEPGLNFTLMFVSIAVSVIVVSRFGGARVSREALSWVGLGVLCSTLLVWRGSGLLRFAGFVAACTAFALPALLAGRAWTRRAGVFEVAEAAVGAWLHAAFGSLRLIGRGGSTERVADSSTGGGFAVLRTLVIGALIAVVPLGIFGALFMSADQVFATLVGDFIAVDVQAYASHLLVAAVLSWLACGYLVGFSTGTRLEVIQRLRPTPPRVGIPEVGTALGLVDLLFLSFVAVQFRYLFGGGSFVEITPDLTYAAYARAGFFQLVAAVALAIPWLLATHSLLEDRGPKARTVFASLAGLQVVLLLVIVASAIQRMLVYQEVYGLTEDRIIVTATLGWLTVVLLWFAATVFSGRRDRFVFGALTTAFALVFALQMINPAAWAARHNLDRFAEAGAVDADHLVSLGSDAVPIVVERLSDLPPASQCFVASSLLDRWSPLRAKDWRSYNRADGRAMHAVADSLVRLEGIVRSSDCRGTGTSTR